MVTYYATPTNMFMRKDGSIKAEWLEVTVIGTLKRHDEVFMLVETLDGAMRFTASADEMFRKTTPQEDVS